MALFRMKTLDRLTVDLTHLPVNLTHLPVNLTHLLVNLTHLLVDLTHPLTHLVYWSLVSWGHLILLLISHPILPVQCVETINHTLVCLISVMIQDVMGDYTCIINQMNLDSLIYLVTGGVPPPELFF
jgi:hypothetical protein